MSIDLRKERRGGAGMSITEAKVILRYRSAISPALIKSAEYAVKEEMYRAEAALAQCRELLGLADDSPRREDTIDD